MSDPSGPILFAYGSNLYPARLLARAPSVRYLEPAVLSGHALQFHKRGRDASAKADATCTGREADLVRGVLFTLDADDEAALDRIEGPGYDGVRVHVETRSGRSVGAKMYQARREWTTHGLRPFIWYRDCVVAGAEHHGFPPAYIRALRAIEAIPDPDPDRRHAESRILGDRTGRRLQENLDQP